MKFGTVIINAGGQNSRMGFDKAFIDINGKPLIQCVIDNCRQEFEEIIIVTNSRDKYSNFKDVIIVQDQYKGIGPIGGLHAGLNAAQSEYVFLTACDMPFINFGLIKHMRNVVKGHDAALVDTNAGIEPFHAFYNKSLIPRIEENVKMGRFSFYKLVKEADTKFIEEWIARKYSSNLDMFTNLNTPEELELFLDKRFGLIGDSSVI